MAGPNWALAGDAAALVDPITGEGLYYALRSGDLLAETLIAGRPANIRRVSAPTFPSIWSLAPASRATSIAAGSWAAPSPRA